MLVRLVYPVNWINTFRLIPGFDFNDKKSAKIGDVTFTTDEADEADLAVIVNFSPYHLKMRAREAWIFHHEPGNYKYFGHWLKSYEHVDRVFGSWRTGGKKYEKYFKNLVNTQPSIFWMCREGYDYYKNLKDVEKTTLISAISSSKTTLKGHRDRLEFLFGLKEALKDEDFNFEISGAGINTFNSKDEILMPSKYSIVIENTSEPHYFTEKITDAFLCNTMPVYFGAPDIFDYFPKNSLIQLDDLDIEKAKEIIKYTVKNNLYEKNSDSILHAKNLVLNKYNFFMNIVEKIAEYDIQNKLMKEINVPKRRQMKHPYIAKIKRKLKGA